jgi:hypothetical protein
MFMHIYRNPYSVSTSARHTIQTVLRELALNLASSFRIAMPAEYLFADDGAPKDDRVDVPTKISVTCFSNIWRPRR